MTIHATSDIMEDERHDTSKSDNGETDYPVETVSPSVMAEIAREGLQVDETGAIPGFLADEEVDEAVVVGEIRPDYEVESEERKEYLNKVSKAVACIVLLIIAIGVPVALTYKNSIFIGQADEVISSPTKTPSTVPSQSPSFMPSSIDFVDVVEKLFPLSGEKLIDVRSPQHKAARWIADEDPRQLDVDDPSFEQRYAMAVLYFSLGGDNWNSKDGWLSEESECKWEFVNGPGCLDGCINGKICALRFDGWMGNQQGTLPDELNVLTEMRHFELQFSNDVSGTIPTSLGMAWTKLTALLVKDNKLHGAFPFSNNPLLGTIFISGNRIEDGIEKLKSLESLSWLEAEGNNLTGTMDAFAELPHLSKVKLTNNTILGTIPDIWTNSSLLESFYVAGNQLHGRLPPSLANIPTLRKLDLGRNLLTGSIPSSFYQMESLQVLHIESNSIGGSLSQAEEPLYYGIQEFAINNNVFEGRFPVDQFEKTDILNVLALQDNQLTGAISNSICQRKNYTNPNIKLKEISVDCDLIECTCCTCY